jgi:hypothetical protein
MHTIPPRDTPRVLLPADSSGFHTMRRLTLARIALTLIVLGVVGCRQAQVRHEPSPTPIYDSSPTPTLESPPTLPFPLEDVPPPPDTGAAYEGLDDDAEEVALPTGFESDEQESTEGIEELEPSAEPILPWLPRPSEEADGPVVVRPLRKRTLPVEIDIVQFLADLHTDAEAEPLTTQPLAIVDPGPLPLIVPQPVPLRNRPTSLEPWPQGSKTAQIQITPAWPAAPRAEPVVILPRSPRRLSEENSTWAIDAIE